MAGGDGGGVGCDHCNSEAAILYCRADSAKLCVMCDQHVHSANPLSLKHIRSQICDNCHSQPVSFVCVSDNLFLCQDCDSDAHSSTNHNRLPVEGFTGCPSPCQLASHLGLLNFTKLLENTNQYQYDEEDDVGDQFMVPNTSNMFAQVSNSTKGLPQSSDGLICGKKKHIIIKQLIHLFHKQQQHKHFENQKEEEEEEDVRWRRKRRLMSTLNDEDEDSNSLLLTPSLAPQLPFTSLLMQQLSTSTSTSQLDVMNEVDQCGFEPGEGGQMLWNTHPSDQGTQVFSHLDFQSLFEFPFSVSIS